MQVRSGASASTHASVGTVAATVSDQLSKGPMAEPSTRLVKAFVDIPHAHVRDARERTYEARARVQPSISSHCNAPQPCLAAPDRAQPALPFLDRLLELKDADGFPKVL